MCIYIYVYTYICTHIIYVNVIYIYICTHTHKKHRYILLDRRQTAPNSGLQ